MSPTTYIAAPAGMTANYFDSEGALHRLPIAAWRQKPEHGNDKHEGDGPNLYPVVAGENGALQHVEAVIALMSQPPRADDLLDRLTERLQADALTTPAGKAVTGKEFGDADRERLGEATEKHTGRGMRPFTAYLVDGPGANDLSVLGRHYDEEQGIIVQTDSEPRHPALNAARDVLIEGGWIKE